jgi:hypothetical protein
MGIETEQLDFHKLLLRKLNSNPVEHLPGNKPARGIPALVFGVSNSHLWTGLGKTHQRIAVGFMLQGPEAEARFQRLEEKERQRDINAALGSPIWRERSRCSIMQKRDCDPFDRTLWDDHMDWMILWLEKFAKTFRWELRA